MMVTGINTTIIYALSELIDEPLLRPEIDLASFEVPKISLEDIRSEDRYVLAQGHMVSASITEQSAKQISAGLSVNLISVMQICELALSHNPKARICVLGSMSAIRGSYDEIYACSKAALHRYVQTRRLSSPDQQLVGVAPTIIEDSGMTQRRSDLQRLESRKELIPKRRFVSAIEVARLIHFLLYVDEGYVTNTMIPMHGGLGT